MNIVAAMEKKKYQIVAIGIDKEGRWCFDEGQRLFGAAEQAEVKLTRRSVCTAILPGAKQSPMIPLSPRRALGEVDVVFPVLHGPFGEDGTVQGLLKLANVPFVGAGVLGSAVGMDKEVMKRLLRDAGIPIGRFITVNRYSSKEISFEDARGELGCALFVKPANLGSSVGIHKVTERAAFERAVRDAFNYDNKILIEAL